MVSGPPQTKPIPFIEIPKAEGQTTLNFGVPYELVEIDGKYEISLDGYVAAVLLERVQVRDSFETLSGFRIHTSGGGKVELTDDSKGILAMTKVELTLPFISRSNYFLQICLEYLNKLVSTWRATTGKYWLKASISDREIISINYETYKPDGTGNRGSMFLPSGKIFYPVKIRDANTEEVMRRIRENLINENKVPTYLKYQLNALNHFIERQFDLTIIEINISLEEYVVHYLTTYLINQGVERREAVKRINNYDGLHRIFDKGFFDIVGKSLKENSELWEEFNKLRMLRKNSVHPFIRLATYDHALEALQYVRNIRQWISSLARAKRMRSARNKKQVK